MQWGDTLTGIAEAYGVSLEELMAVNELAEGYIIQPGDVLTIPQ